MTDTKLGADVEDVPAEDIPAEPITFPIKSIRECDLETATKISNSTVRNKEGIRIAAQWTIIENLGVNEELGFYPNNKTVDDIINEGLLRQPIQKRR
jgi:hypothetical protein